MTLFTNPAYKFLLQRHIKGGHDAKLKIATARSYSISRKTHHVSGSRDGDSHTNLVDVGMSRPEFRMVFRANCILPRHSAPSERYVGKSREMMHSENYVNSEVVYLGTLVVGRLFTNLLRSKAIRH